MKYDLIFATRNGAVVARRAHNPKVVGSSPASATTKDYLEKDGLFLCLFFILESARAISELSIIGSLFNLHINVWGIHLQFTLTYFRIPNVILVKSIEALYIALCKSLSIYQLLN